MLAVRRLATLRFGIACPSAMNHWGLRGLHGCPIRRLVRVLAETIFFLSFLLSREMRVEGTIRSRCGMSTCRRCTNSFFSFFLKKNKQKTNELAPFLCGPCTRKRRGASKLVTCPCSFRVEFPKEEKKFEVLHLKLCRRGAKTATRARQVKIPTNAMQTDTFNLRPPLAPGNKLIKRTGVSWRLFLFLLCAFFPLSCRRRFPRQCAVLLAFRCLSGSSFKQAPRKNLRRLF